MTHSPLWVRRPASTQLQALLREQSGLPLSYSTPGMTRGTPPAIYRDDTEVVDLGVGDGAFRSAVATLQQWGVHHRAGLGVTAQGPAATDTCAVLLITFGAFYVTAACRVLYTVKDSSRWGFAYGTLPHHVEIGEELFLVEQDDEGRVRFTVRAVSRSGHPLVVVGGPLSRSLQRSATKRYLKAMVELTTLPDP